MLRLIVKSWHILKSSNYLKFKIWRKSWNMLNYFARFNIWLTSWNILKCWDAISRCDLQSWHILKSWNDTTLLRKCFVWARICKDLEKCPWPRSEDIMQASKEHVKPKQAKHVLTTLHEHPQWKSPTRLQHRAVKHISQEAGSQRRFTKERVKPPVEDFFIFGLQAFPQKHDWKLSSVEYLFDWEKNSSGVLIDPVWGIYYHDVFGGVE